MPEGRKFSHISVNAAEDDDIVIEAGAYAKPAAVPTSESNSAPSQAPASQYGPEPELESEAAPAAASAQVNDSEPQPQASAAPEPQEAPDEKAAAKAHASDAPRDTYDQTLEDLERTPMPSMQRNVLIGLAIVVIASCIYYIVRFVL
jgi:cobalamin biosynthesis Mg chelatase CobN